MVLSKKEKTVTAEEHPAAATTLVVMRLPASSKAGPSAMMPTKNAAKTANFLRLIPFAVNPLVSVIRKRYALGQMRLVLPMLLRPMARIAEIINSVQADNARPAIYNASSLWAAT
jgi:hypothetical protein